MKTNKIKQHNINKKLGYSFIELVITIIIMSILTSYSSSYLFKEWNELEIAKDYSKTEDLVSNIIRYYDETGVYATDVEELSNYTTINLLDRYGEKIQIVKNSDNSLFNVDGKTIYKMAIVLKGNNKELDSKITSNVFSSNGEKVYLITDTMFNSGYRNSIKTNLNKCNTRITVYSNIIGGLPTNIYELVTNDYLKANDIIDKYGNELIYDVNLATCYSIGLNGVNENGNGDDITLLN